MLLRMYLRWAQRRGFQTELNEASEGDEAGIKSATFTVHGENAYGLLSAERGYTAWFASRLSTLPADAHVVRFRGHHSVGRGRGRA